MVVAGLVAPFTFRNDPGPLKFMKAVLSGRTEFDIWAVHPYTSGGPRHHAVKSTDVSLGDLPKARSVLNAAVRARHVVSTHPVQLWVTEFSWDSKPPDSHGVPLGTGGAMGFGGALPRLAGRREHVHLVPAQGRSDELAVPVWALFPQRDGEAGSGRLPVPLRRPQSIRGASTCGAARPGDSAATAVIERKSGSGWKRVAQVKTNGVGIFARTLPLRLPASSFMRARISSARSIAFPLRLPPDVFVNPFGVLAA